IRNHSMRCRPAYAEKLGEDRFPRFEQACFVIGVPLTFIRHQKTRTADHSVSARGEPSFDVSDVGYSSGRENGIVVANGATDSIEQLDRRKPAANVASSLNALSDDGIGSRIASRERLFDRST